MEVIMNKIDSSTQVYEADQNDELARFRSEFIENDTIYLDGNSLGKLPKKSIELVNTIVENQWGNRMIRSWNEHWIDLPKRIASKIAQIVGASEDEIFVGDTTSINLYKLAFAALKFHQNQTQIITDSLNFPTDLYVLDGLIKNHFNNHQLHIIESKNQIDVEMSDFEKAINPNTALVCLSHVLYKSAFMYDMKQINDLAHQQNALVLWDLSHATGAVPIKLNEWGADLAVGCTYKYLNGGPGSPAFLYIRKDLQEKLINPIWAWFSHQRPFDFSSEFRAADSIQRFATSTPSILSLAPIEVGVDIFLRAGMDKVRAKSIQQSDFLLKMIQEHLIPRGFTIASPIDSDKRGSHISIQHSEGYRINQALINPKDDSTTIIPDFRPPNNIRLGIAPLYNTFEELFLCVERIIKIVDERQYEAYSTDIVGVT
jgi:kynureninase